LLFSFLGWIEIMPGNRCGHPNSAAYVWQQADEQEFVSR
jgi:hypothetical protein